MTPEAMNAALIEEFKRLGGREQIDAVLKEFGVTGVSGLNPSQYADVLAKVRAK